ncbi:MAG: NfeD family protein [Syntrophobacteraceae bacterium]
MPDQLPGEKWTTRIIARYVLLQSPGWILLFLFLLLLNSWFDLPWWSWGILVLSVAKDAVLYPFVWRAYDPDPSNTAYRLKGVNCIAKDRLAPTGYVLIHGELWLAETVPGGPVVEEGEKARIMDVRGLTLIVKKEV